MKGKKTITIKSEVKTKKRSNNNLSVIGWITEKNFMSYSLKISIIYLIHYTQSYVDVLLIDIISELLIFYKTIV